jgi:NTE family protein
MIEIKKIEALVFEGGGVKGIAHCGALYRLEQFGINTEGIMFIAGTSAGSQVAALLACGYSVDELRDILLTLPFTKFMDKSWGYILNLKRLICNYGIHKGDFMEEYIDDLISKKLGKKRATFMDLKLQTLKTLRITGTCLTTSTLEYFDVMRTPDMPISKAIRISSSIPLFFSAVKYQGKHYVDGGVIRNLPILAFPKTPTIFLMFKDDNTVNHKEHRKIKNIIKYLTSLLEVAVIHSNKLSVKHGFEDNHEDSFIVKIDTEGISSTDFELDDYTKHLLLTEGEAAVRKVFEQNIVN